MAVRSAFALALASACAEGVSVSTATSISMEATARAQYLHRREYEHKHGMERITSNMTTTNALDIVLHKSKPELQSFIQTSIGSKKQHLRAGGQLFSSDAKTQYEGLEKAVKMLNEMIEESQEKYDLEVEKCCAYDMYQSGLMEQAKQDIAKFNAEAAEARACVLEQNGYISDYEGILPRITEELEAHNAECKHDIDELRRLLEIVNFDIGIMDDILGIIGTCSGEGDYTTTAAPEFIQQNGFQMQRCMAQGEDGASCSFFQFHDGKVQTALNQLKSDQARDLVQDNLQEMHERELAEQPATTMNWELVVADIDVEGQEPIDVGKEAFNAKFAASGAKIIKRVCPDCDPEYQELYYKRLTPIGGWDAYTAMTSHWTKESADGATNKFSNVLGTDFNIFTSEYDAQNDQNPWKFCSYDTDGEGFPGGCGKTDADKKTDQWAAIGGAKNGQGKGAAFYVTEPPAWTPETLPKRMLTRNRPCKLPKATNKNSLKCTPSPPNCLKMKERFTYIKAGMVDTKADLEEQLTGRERYCEKEKANYEAQIAQYEAKLRDAQNKLAVCTGTMNYNDMQSQLKSEELKSLQEDYRKMTKECHGNYKAHENDICGIKKIRTELKKVRGDAATMGVIFYQDCVVGEWVAGECSHTCGDTGMLRLERKILTAPVGGAKCPALVAQETCNRRKCPIDCRLEEWSGWSGCTAKCGGGIMERSREIEVEPMHGGEPCGETAESTSCNIQSCDQDCKLYDWTPWTDCSKECNGGHLVHYRRIEKQAIGNGECAHWWDRTRLDIAECNMFPCEANLMCASTLDVVLVIDGSGSLGQTGWDASKKAGAMLARAFGGSNTGTGADATGPVMISVILFSYWSEVKTHFTYDTEAAATTIENMQWPRSLTYTAKALNLAKDELQMGRADSESIVIVITDGRPMSERDTKEAAKWLRKSARLLFVPVTQWAPLAAIKEWASFPREENIVQVNDFADLETPSVADKIIADACKHVVGPTTTTTTTAR